MRLGAHPVEQAARARCAFAAGRGNTAAWVRQRKIDALPTVQWKGHALKTLRCVGTSGKGPHDVNLPEAVLWSLMSLNAFLCPFHVNDRDMTTTKAKADPPVSEEPTK